MAVKTFSNLELAQKSGVSHASVKRWTRAFLPPDAYASRQSGHARKLTHKDTFMVLLGGNLVRLGAILTTYTAHALLQRIDKALGQALGRDWTPPQLLQRWDFMEILCVPLDLGTLVIEDRGRVLALDIPDRAAWPRVVLEIRLRDLVLKY